MTTNHIQATPAYCAAFHPNDHFLAVGRGDRKLYVRDVVNDKMVAVLGPHRGVVTSVAFSNDGKLIASGSNDHFVRLWKLDKKGKPDEKSAVWLGEHFARVTALAFSHDCKMLASGDSAGCLTVWKLGNEKPYKRIEGREPISCVRFSPPGDVLVVGHVRPFKSAGAFIWKLDEDKEAHRAKCEVDCPLSLTVSPKGRAILVGSKDGLKVWDMIDDKLAGSVADEDVVGAVEFNDSGSVAATAAVDGSVRIWDGERGIQLGPAMADPGSLVNGLAVAARSQLVAAVCQSGRVAVYYPRLSGPPG